MNTTRHPEVNRPGTLVAAAIAFILVAAWVFVPIRPEGAAAAPPQAEKELTAHGVYPAGHKAAATHLAAASAEQQAAELQRQLDLLHAKRADDGWVLTLGDVIFTSGRAEFKSGVVGSLSRLVSFLGKYPQRRVAIHGYTDSLGSEDYNQGLSERRANSVKAYLAAQGIDSTRLSALGMGWRNPVAGNESEAGRQQNRRVEITISNPPAALNQRYRTAKLLTLLALLESLSGNAGRPLL